MNIKRDFTLLCTAILKAANVAHQEVASNHDISLAGPVQATKGIARELCSHWITLPDIGGAYHGKTRAKA
jgi:hypothetical protein